MNSKDFCQVLISATSKREADKIVDTFLKKRLIAGGLIVQGPSKYFWDNEIEEKEYFNISAFSILKNKSKIISEAENLNWIFPFD